jgi:hypothetical protein
MNLFKKSLIILMSYLIIITPVFAQDAPTKLIKGQTFVVPADGWFFTVEAEKTIRMKLLDTDYFEKSFKLSQDNILHLNNELTFQQGISDKYRTAWQDSENTLTNVLKKEGRTKFWYFLGGMLLTIGAGISIGYAAKAIK